MKTEGASLEVLREAVANYMSSEGCGCCQNRDAHKKHEEVLAKLLNVERYDDDSGYNFHKYRTPRKGAG